MNKTTTKRIKALILAVALLSCACLSVISAYFTDADTETNTFTVGKISLQLLEPNWAGQPDKVAPNDEYAKDLQIKNDGINPEYVFLEVLVPHAEIVTAGANGTKAEAEDTPLFSFINSDNATGINEGWVKVAETLSDYDDYIHYIYAYGTEEAMKALNANETTVPVFNTVRFANVVEDQGLEKASKNIIVNAYGIQHDFINNGNGTSKTAPADVWEVVKNQREVKYEKPPVDGQVYMSGDYKYIYSEIDDGWKVTLNEDVTSDDQTSYGPILEEIKGKPVVSMDGTFSSCESLTTAPVIPEGVTNMDSTFSGCESLTGTVEINADPSSYEECFYGTKKSITLTGTSTKLTELAATTNNSNITVQPNTTEDPVNGEIYKYGDYKYTYNESICGWDVALNYDITDSKQTSYGPILDKIKNKPVVNMNTTFFNCESMTTAPAIPNSVQLMVHTFYNCTSLTVAPAIPEGVTNMGNTFQNCTALTSVPVIPSSVTFMRMTFMNCTSLIAAPIIPEGVADMDYAFKGCTALTVAPTIPNSVRSMGNAFEGCTSLTAAPLIPEGVTYISEIFKSCTALTGEIEINANPHYCSDCFYDTEQPIVLKGTSTMLNELAATANNGNVTVQQ